MISYTDTLQDNDMPTPSKILVLYYATAMATLK